MNIFEGFLGRIQMSRAAWSCAREDRKQILTTKPPKRGVLQHLNEQKEEVYAY